MAKKCIHLVRRLKLTRNSVYSAALWRITVGGGVIVLWCSAVTALLLSREYNDVETKLTERDRFAIPLPGGYRMTSAYGEEGHGGAYLNWRTEPLVLRERIIGYRVVDDLLVARLGSGYVVCDLRYEAREGVVRELGRFPDGEKLRSWAEGIGLHVDVPLERPIDVARGLPYWETRPWEYRATGGVIGLSDYDLGVIILTLPMPASVLLGLVVRWRRLRIVSVYVIVVSCAFFGGFGLISPSVGLVGGAVLFGICLVIANAM